jgi:transcriptional activator SPT7
VHSGDFADALGEDYLGLRELGIAAEFGMSSLSIPKKLLRGKKAQNKLLSAAYVTPCLSDDHTLTCDDSAKPTEPPPPYPPPPPFIPLASDKVDDQIGLLKTYYQSRFAALALSSHQPPSLPPPSSKVPPLPGPSLPGQPTRQVAPVYGANPYPTIHPTPTPEAEDSETEPRPPAPATAPAAVLILPDDPPNPIQVKMGPLGQILKGGPAGGSMKKKKALPGAGDGAGGGGGGDNGTEGGISSPAKKKKTGMVGVGTGNGRKKKLLDAEGQGQGQIPIQGFGVQGLGRPLPALAAPMIPPPVMAVPPSPLAAS